MKEKPDLSSVDFFKASREALSERLGELVAKYGLADAIPYEVEQVARDTLMLARMGQIDEGEFAEVLQDSRDIVLLAHCMRVDANDDGARAALHGVLSDALQEDRTTQSMRTLLAAMHNALSRGLPADAAMLVKPPGRRPSQASKHAAIRRYVEMQSASARLFGAMPDPDAIHKDAARIFGVSKKTVANIVAS